MNVYTVVLRSGKIVEVEAEEYTCVDAKIPIFKFFRREPEAVNRYCTCTVVAPDMIELKIKDDDTD